MNGIILLFCLLSDSARIMPACVNHYDMVEFAVEENPNLFGRSTREQLIFWNWIREDNDYRVMDNFTDYARPGQLFKRTHVYRNPDTKLYTVRFYDYLAETRRTIYTRKVIYSYGNFDRYWDDRNAFPDVDRKLLRERGD